MKINREPIVQAKTLQAHSLPLGKFEKGAISPGWRWSYVWVHSLVSRDKAVFQLFVSILVVLVQGVACILYMAGLSVLNKNKL